MPPKSSVKQMQDTKSSFNKSKKKKGEKEEIHSLE